MKQGNLTLDWARRLAGRVLETAGKDQSAQIDRAYRLTYSRAPDAWEKDTVSSFLHKQKGLITERVAKGEKLALPWLLPEGVEPAYAAALVDFCHMLLNSNEFVYRN